MGTEQPKVEINLQNSAINLADDELTEEIDNTTDASYTFVSQTFDEKAATSDPVWRCYRITNATGTKKWATDPATSKKTRQFALKASLAATYTY